MARKLIAKYDDIRVHRDSDWNEYIVTDSSLDLERREATSYHTDDKEDALGTARAWSRGELPGTEYKRAADVEQARPSSIVEPVLLAGRELRSSTYHEPLKAGGAYGGSGALSIEPAGGGLYVLVEGGSGRVVSDAVSRESAERALAMRRERIGSHLGARSYQIEGLPRGPSCKNPPYPIDEDLVRRGIQDSETGCFLHSTSVQSVLFDRDLYSEESAKDWLKKQNEKTGRRVFRYGDAHGTANKWRFRQWDPEEAEPGTYRTIDVPGTRGIQFVIAVRAVGGLPTDE